MRRHGVLEVRIDNKFFSQPMTLFCGGFCGPRQYFGRSALSGVSTETKVTHLREAAKLQRDMSLAHLYLGFGLEQVDRSGEAELSYEGSRIGRARAGSACKSTTT